jgi:cell division protein FtsW
MRNRGVLVAPDVCLLLTALLLTVAGVILVFDASYAKAGDLKTLNYDVYYLVKRQVKFAAVGLVLMLVAMRISFERLKQITLPLLGAVMVLLIAVLILGHRAHGATSWFRIGTFSLQPSELAKLAAVFYLAGVLSRPNVFGRSQRRVWVVPALVCAGLVGLIVAQRDLGTATVLAVVCLVMFFTAGAKKVYLALIAIVGLAMVAAMMFAMPHCRARIRAWLDPWQYRYAEGYQTVHSLSGLGTGGLFGVGPCEGREKFYMPAASTDYVFATLGEEAGLVGGLALMAVFVFFTYRGLHLAYRSASPYGALLAAGVTSLISVQALVNLAVVSSAIPATGLPLPFISYGGSSLVATLVGVGILLSVSRQVNVSAEERESREGSNNGRWNGRTRVSGDQRRAGPLGHRAGRRAVVRR